jgi:putative hydrolase of the HAD superfamily
MTEQRSLESRDGVPRIVFFDAGNTLLHVHPSIGQVYSEVSKEFGCSVSPEELEKGLLEAWGEYLKERRYKTAEGLETSEEHEYEMWRTLTYALHDRVSELTCERRPWFEALHKTFGEPRRFRLFPDVMDTLQALDGMGIRIGIISNWDRRLESILGGMGLGELLDVVVISSLVGYSKPHPRIFEIALEKAELSPEEAVHVGDTFRDDIEGAQSVGIRPVLIKRTEGMGISAKYLLSKRPTSDYPFITSLSELPKMLSSTTL